MLAHSRRLAIVIVICALSAAAQTASDNDTWHFAVSGDSRNCGDVIMRGIQAGVKRDQAAFYWHLGDLRAIFEVDEDVQRMVEVNKPPHFYISDYEGAAWDDFIKNQVAPFGDLPFYLGIGNHEMISPKIATSSSSNSPTGSTLRNCATSASPITVPTTACEPIITGLRAASISSISTMLPSTSSTAIN